MAKKPLKVPKFKSEDHEREFWSQLDLADYFERADFETISFPNLKPSSRSISLRLTEAMLMRLKEEANRLNIPYQSLIKQYIAKGIRGQNE
ncbi:MAG TPA: BrnA antitoxin family protein [Candidatus Andersenbacteria bacterium]|nr:BrnA antitoxin family protein [Candidatus Andersenbacteria bacterium]